MSNYSWKEDKPLIFALNKNWDLPAEVADVLGVELFYIEVTQFADGEFKTRFEEHIRRRKVYLKVENSPAQKFVEVLFALDSLSRSSVGEINLIIPYPGWLRQDRIKFPHESLNAKIVYELLDNASRVARFVVMDPHTAQANLAVNNPWEILFSAPYIIRRFKELDVDLDDTTVVAADFGISHTAMYIARKLGTNLAIIDKRRLTDTDTEVKRLIVEGELKTNLLFVDDIISTFGTAQSDIDYVLRENGGGRRLFLAAPHAVLAGPALERIKSSSLEKIFVTNTVYLSPEKRIDKIEIISVAHIFAEAIYRIHCPGGSVSDLYDIEQRK